MTHGVLGLTGGVSLLRFPVPCRVRGGALKGQGLVLVWVDGWVSLLGFPVPSRVRGGALKG